MKGPRAENATHYITYGLDPSIEELPDESMLADRHYAAERAGVPMSDSPALPSDDYISAARRLIGSPQS